MGQVVAIGALGALILVLGAVLHRQLQEKRSLRQSLSAATTELERFAPIREVNKEVAQKRRELAEEVDEAKRQIEAARRELDADIARKRQEAEKESAALDTRILSLRQELAEAEALLREYELRLDLEEMGFYQPKFDFEDAPTYAEALDLVREAQRELTRQKRIFEGIEAQTPKAMKNLGKLAVDAFNGEATKIISGVSYSNFEASIEKLRTEFHKINNLLEVTRIRISTKYLELKVKEMAIAYDYREAEEKAKQEQAEIKEMMREEEDARAEAEEARQKAIEEERRYQEALEAAREEMESKSVEEREIYEKKLQELEAQLEAAHADRERATSMAQITRKGHVYIISNIGSFGEGVLKIGMTRRTQPDERIRELGDASVPFGFDVHALVRADEAPTVEAALHNHFETRRMNKVNLRKEFFRVSIDELDAACRQLGYTVRLTKLAEAREYRATLELEAKASRQAAREGIGPGAV